MRKKSSVFATNKKGKLAREKVDCGDLSGIEKPNIWEHGQLILAELRNTSFAGLTGM